MPRIRLGIRERVGQVVDVPVAVGRARPVGLISADGKTTSLDSLTEQSCFVFSAIGNPGAFEQSVRDLGIKVVGTKRFRDHHRFTRDELMAEAGSAKESGATALLCTHKDLVKVATQRLAGLEVWALLIEFEITAGEQPLKNLVAKLFAQEVR